jgi:hypothetical protein
MARKFETVGAPSRNPRQLPPSWHVNHSQTYLTPSGPPRWVDKLLNASPTFSRSCRRRSRTIGKYSKTSDALSRSPQMMHRSLSRKEILYYSDSRNRLDQYTLVNYFIVQRQALSADFYWTVGIKLRPAKMRICDEYSFYMIELFLLNAYFDDNSKFWWMAKPSHLRGRSHLGC